MCNGLYWVCTHSGNMDDENMNVFVIFFTDNNESYGREFMEQSLC